MKWSSEDTGEQSPRPWGTLQGSQAFESVDLDSNPDSVFLSLGKLLDSSSLTILIMKNGIIISVSRIFLSNKNISKEVPGWN